MKLQKPQRAQRKIHAEDAEKIQSCNNCCNFRQHEYIEIVINI